ncbi:cell envelope biogenesis protein OmpA [Labrys neptuniae]
MKRTSGLVLITGLAVGMASCSSSPGGRAFNGALIGGTSGAIVGSLVSRQPTAGAVVGGAIGAATGAIVGLATTPAPSRSTWF